MNQRQTPFDWGDKHQVEPDVPTMVIVDDYDVTRTLLQDMAEHLGFRVLAAGRNGIDACKLYVRFRPDILIVDEDMPLVGGRAALNVLRTTFPCLKAVCLSETLQEQDLAPSERDHVWILRKPFMIGSLEAIARELLRQPASQTAMRKLP